MYNPAYYIHLCAHVSRLLVLLLYIGLAYFSMLDKTTNSVKILHINPAHRFFFGLDRKNYLKVALKI